MFSSVLDKQSDLEVSGWAGFRGTPPSPRLGDSGLPLFIFQVGPRPISRSPTADLSTRYRGGPDTVCLSHHLQGLGREAKAFIRHHTLRKGRETEPRYMDPLCLHTGFRGCLFLPPELERRCHKPEAQMDLPSHLQHAPHEADEKGGLVGPPASPD